MPISWLDLVLVALILLHLALGLGQGFVLGVMGLVGLVAAIAAVLFGAPWITAWLTAAFGWPSGPVLIGVAIALLIAVRVVVGMISGHLRSRVDRAPLGVRRLDRGLGLLPGAAWGLGTAAVVAWLYGAFIGPLPADSPVATRLLAAAESPIAEVTARVSGAMPGLVIMPEGIELVPGGGAGEAPVPPSELEREMLDLVNQERAKAGLKPLAWDGRLAEVGRTHSRDMIERDYFAHVAPDGGTVATRVQAAGVRYLLVGENLAFAPTLGVAHRGLMQSPGHRENILRPGFGRVGIGIVRLEPGEEYRPERPEGKPALPLRASGGYLMVTQVFKN
ncbi:MAG: CvpA family protein [Candidatus Sericytochromatia bacterium]